MQWLGRRVEFKGARLGGLSGPWVMVKGPLFDIIGSDPCLNFRLYYEIQALLSCCSDFGGS